MKTSKKLLLALSIISLFIVSSCWKTADQKAKEIKEADKKVNIIWIMKDWNPDWCNVINDLQKRKNCVNNLYYNNAIVKNDATICDKIEKADSKSICKAQVYYNSALTASDDKICDKIEKENTKNDCKNNIILNKVLQESNIELCKNFIWEISLCKDEANRTFAITKNDIKYCKLIKDKNKQNICKMNVEQSNPNSWTNSTWTLQSNGN